MAETENPQVGPKRPRYVLLALIALILVGFQTFSEGLQYIYAATDSTFAATQSADLDPAIQVAVRTQLESLGELKQRSLPLGIAQLLLGGVLAFISVRGLFGRSSTAALLQFGLANMFLLTLSFVLTAEVRDAAIVAVSEFQHPDSPTITTILPFIFGVRLVFPLSILALCLYGVSRPRAREYIASRKKPIHEGE